MRYTFLLAAIFSTFLSNLAIQVSALPQTQPAPRVLTRADHVRLASQGLCATQTGKILRVGGHKEHFNTNSNSNSTSAPLSKRQIGPLTWTATNNMENKCAGSSFENQSSGGSPWVYDCYCLLNYYQATRGYYGFTRPFKYNTPVWCGSCVFGFGTANVLGAEIGNEDIFDLMRDSINMFRWFDRIGAKGQMSCGTNDGIFGPIWAGVDWAIFGSGQ